MAAAQAYLESVRRAVASHAWETVTGGLRVTVSIGSTSTVITEPTPAALLGRADEHLYRAKADGRDRVVTD